MDMDNPTRREVLLGALGSLGVVSMATPTASDTSTAEGELGVGGEPDVLAINPGESYVVEGTETYRALVWADTGELDLRNGGIKLA